MNPSRPPDSSAPSGQPVLSNDARADAIIADGLQPIFDQANRFRRVGMAILLAGGIAELATQVPAPAAGEHGKVQLLGEAPPPRGAWMPDVPRKP